MKRYLFYALLFFTISSTAQSHIQTHQFGLGWGATGVIYMSLKKSFPNYEASYTFSDKIFVFNCNYTFAPLNNYKTQSMKSFMVLIGIQTYPKYRITGRFGLGVRGLFPTNKTPNKYPLENQANIILKHSMALRINSYNSIGINIYQSFIKYETRRGVSGGTENTNSPDLGFTIGYLLTLSNK